MSLADEKKELLKRLETIVKNEKIIKAIEKIKREDFVLPEFKDMAYEDRALPIEENQTISQPSTIAAMLELLELKNTHEVLEIGTGCGYNAALLSKLSKQVYTIDVKQKLVEIAKKNLKKAGITNVAVIKGDGSKGYEKAAPYDRIIVTCACKEILNSWKNQLKEGGIIVAPVGEHEQVMVVARKIKGEFSYQKHGHYLFVPLVKE